MIAPAFTRDDAIETLQKIRAAAETALKEGVSSIMVTVLRDHAPSSDNVMLCGSSGPRGHLVNAVPTEQDGRKCWRVVGRFRAAKLITFCGQTIETILKESS